MELEKTKPTFGPLSGVKVVYQAVEVAAPTAAAMMADWGADVIWLENTYYGDTMRDTMFIKEQARLNQRSVSMNPFSEEGREVFFRLIKDADIFIQAGKGPTYERKACTICALGSQSRSWSSCMFPASGNTAPRNASRAPHTTI